MVSKNEVKKAIKLTRQVQDSLNKKKFVQGVSLSGGALQEFNTDTGIVNVTVPSGAGGTASLGTVLSAIDSLPSIEGGNILYASDTNTFQPVELSPFAINFLQCSSPQQLRNYWAGIRDVDFDDCGNSWAAFGSPFMSSKNAKFHKALQLNGSSYLKSSPINLSSVFSIQFFFSFSSISTMYLFDIIDSNYRIMLNLQTDGKLRFRSFRLSDSSAFATYSQSALSTNQLYFLSWLHSYNTDSFFIDNVLQDSVSNFYSPSSNSTIYLGVNNAPGGFFNGSISEFHISNCIRDTAVPSSPFSPDSDSISLLHFNG